jgi:arylsulfatase A-like enzyme
MRLPGGAKGINNELVQNIDYAPTFLEAAGIDIPDDIQGESLLPLLKGKAELEGRTALYYHYFEYPAEHMVKRHNGIRTDRYKLIHYYNDIDVWELYDLQNDPTEMNNIYGQEGTEKLTRELKQQLAELQTKYGEEEYIAE